MRHANIGDAARSWGATAKTWGASCALLLAATVICGVVYTGACTGVAQLVFPHQANGSIIEVDGVKYGSELVAQEFHDEDHMWGRVMNANPGTFVNDAGEPVMWYGPSNLSPASAEFEAVVRDRLAKIEEAHPEMRGVPVPSDLVTCSGSGFDPHISPAAAEYQVKRLAKNTGMSESEIRSIIDQCTDRPMLGILGDAGVNVLEVNLMIDGVLAHK